MIFTFFDFLLDNIGSVSHEQGECFHQVTSTIEHYEQGHVNPLGMGDYYWGLVRVSDKTVNRKKNERKVLQFSILMHQ